MGASFLVDLMLQSQGPRGGALNQPEISHLLALSILDPVEHAQDHFLYCYQFVNSDFRPCCYGVARCINLKKFSAHLPS